MSRFADMPAARTQAASGTEAFAGESAASGGSDSRALDAKCKEMRCETTVIGYDESEAAGLRASALLRARNQAREGVPAESAAGSASALPLEPRIVEKGLASDARSDSHGGGEVLRPSSAVPASQRCWSAKRALEISRATLDGWVMRVGELLQPVVAAMRQDLLSESYLQADETTVPVQMHDNRGANHQAYLWQYGKPGGETVFEF